MLRNLASILILTLAGIGLLVKLINDWLSLLIYLVIFVILFYLYKFPPKWLLRIHYAQNVPKPKKKYPFRVIKGNKQN